MPLLTWEVFDVYTSEVAQSVLVVGGVVPDDTIIFAREVIKPAVDRRHPRQVIQHFLHVFNDFLETYGQRRGYWNRSHSRSGHQASTLKRLGFWEIIWQVSSTTHVLAQTCMPIPIIIPHPKSSQHGVHWDVKCYEAVTERMKRQTKIKLKSEKQRRLHFKSDAATFDRLFQSEEKWHTHSCELWLSLCLTDAWRVKCATMCYIWSSCAACLFISSLKTV